MRRPPQREAFSFQHCPNSPIHTLNKLKRAGRTAVRPPPSRSHAQFALPHLSLSLSCRTHCSASPSSSSRAQFALPHLSLSPLCRRHCSASPSSSSHAQFAFLTQASPHRVGRTAVRPPKKIISKRNLWFAPPVKSVYFIGNDRITTNDIEEYSLIKSS